MFVDVWCSNFYESMMIVEWLVNVWRIKQRNVFSILILESYFIYFIKKLFYFCFQKIWFWSGCYVYGYDEIIVSKKN